MKKISVLLFLAILLNACALRPNSGTTPAEAGSTESAAKASQPAVEEATEQSPDVAASESEAAVADTVSPEAAAPEAEEVASASTSSETEPAVEEAAPAEAPSDTPKDTTTLSSVEILWQVPGEAVEYYYLRYGTDSGKLDKKDKIAVKDLEKIDHPEHGPLFKYVISGVPAEQTIYFTIQAENQFGLSPESPVQQVDAQ